MKNKFIKKQIKIVVEKIKEEYQYLHVDFEFLKDYNVYEIWFNREELRDDIYFNTFLGKLITEYFWKNDIYNLFIDYNEERSKKLVGV